MLMPIYKIPMEEASQLVAKGCAALIKEGYKSKTRFAGSLHFERDKCVLVNGFDNGSMEVSLCAGAV